MSNSINTNFSSPPDFDSQVTNRESETKNNESQISNRSASQISNYVDIGDNYSLKNNVAQIILSDISKIKLTDQNLSRVSNSVLDPVRTQKENRANKILRSIKYDNYEKYEVLIRKLERADEIAGSFNWKYKILISKQKLKYGLVYGEEGERIKKLIKELGELDNQIIELKDKAKAIHIDNKFLGVKDRYSDELKLTKKRIAQKKSEKKDLKSRMPLLIKEKKISIKLISEAVKNLESIRDQGCKSQDLLLLLGHACFAKAHYCNEDYAKACSLYEQFSGSKEVKNLAFNLLRAKFLSNLNRCTKNDLEILGNRNPSSIDDILLNKSIMDILGKKFAKSKEYKHLQAHLHFLKGDYIKAYNLYDNRKPRNEGQINECLDRIWSDCKGSDRIDKKQQDILLENLSYLTSKYGKTNRGVRDISRMINAKAFSRPSV